MTLSDYEVRRMQRIKANEAKLNELGLGGEGVVQKRPAQKQRKAPKEEDVPRRLTRVSKRAHETAPNTRSSKPRTRSVNLELDSPHSESAPPTSDSSDSDPEYESEVDTSPRTRGSGRGKPTQKGENDQAPSAPVTLGTDPRDEPAITVEHAKTGRSKCRGCMEIIEKDEMRVGTEGWMVGRRVTVWQHPPCFLKGVRVVAETSGRGRCKHSKETFAVGENKIEVTAHTTTSCFKLDAAALLLQPIYGTKELSKINGIDELSASEKKTLLEKKHVQAQPSQEQVSAEKRERSEHPPPKPKPGTVSGVYGRVRWRFAGALCYGTLMPERETETHCYALTHRGNTKSLPKSSGTWKPI